MPDPLDIAPVQTVLVYPATSLFVFIGANQGDPVGPPDACLAGDIYRLRPGARRRRLNLQYDEATPARVRLAEGSDIGTVGEALRLAGLLTFMAADGDRIEVLLLSSEAGGAAYALPLSPMLAQTDYTLVALSADVGRVPLGDVICVSFAAGTRITLPDGTQRPIEALAPGDLVLTRDHGAQPVRWLGRATMRAKGGFAPVIFEAGVLGNSGDLMVSAHHRIFIYQRGGARLGRTAELLVQAKHLVDGERVRRQSGGFVDYYSLIFERHEIIFAEGIAAESLLVNDATLRRIPAELAEELKARLPGLNQSACIATELHARDIGKDGRAMIFGR